jgi:Sulfotransferase domain
VVDPGHARVAGADGALPALGALPPVPEAPPGWLPGPPDFVGVGTIRSGTTWWHYLVARHPGVAKPAERAKEIHYFDQFIDPGRRVDPAEYYAYFPRPEGKLCGEWTPNYIFYPWAPPLLARLAPAARLLVILRDPVDRIISALTYISQKKETQGAEAEVGDTMVNREFIRSLYWYQLRELLEHFPRRQLLVLQYEKCVRDTDRQLTRTFEFLGLDPDRFQLNSRHFRRRNATTVPKIAVERKLDDEARAILRRDLAALADNFPEVDQALWPSARL